MATLALALPTPQARADTAPPAGFQAGTGQFEGTELIEDQVFLGIPCFKTTRSVYGLQGAGTFQGVTASGQSVVYNAQIAGGQQLYADGPLHIEVENTQLYYHGPDGTHGTTDSTCGSATAGASVPAEFRFSAADHVYRLDGGGAQVPCVGHGSFARSDYGSSWKAQWTLDSDCTVVGNAAGTPGTGIAKAGTGFTDSGSHGPCFDTCTDNIKFDYVQYLPYLGLHLGLTGPASAEVNTAATLTANLTDDGLPVASSLVSFSVSGPAAASPSSATVATGADGRAVFSFTAATVGAYVVTATTPSTTNPGDVLTATSNVQVTPPPPPAVTLSGPSAAQTEESVYIAATFTNDDQPVQNVQVRFSVTGPGTATPASGTATTDSNGWALFSFVGDRAGAYTVTASATYFSQRATDTFTVPLVINTLSRQDTLTFPTAEGALRSAVIDPVGDFAYFADRAGVAKVDLRTFERVDFISSNSTNGPAVIDPAGRYAYFANNISISQAQILKVDLSTFEPVGTLTLPDNERSLRSAVIDPAGRYAYYGFGRNPGDVGNVARIDLESFQQTGTITFASDETTVESALMSPAGDFAYFGAQGAQSLPARLVKVDLATFQRVGSLPMADANENAMKGGSLIDPTGHFAYLAVQPSTGPSSVPARIVKVDLTTFSRVASITLESFSAYFNTVETNLSSGVMDPGGTFAYFGTSDGAGDEQRVIRVDLRTFERSPALTVADLGHGVTLRSAVIAPDGTRAYFGTDPGNTSNAPKVLKLALNRPPNPALAAANDTYTTSYLTPLSVAAPGVLANDVNNADAYPLAAGQATAPAHGSVTVAANGSFTYTPDAGFTGTDTFTYTADNARDYSAPATVSITVGAPPSGVSAVGGGAVGFYTNVGLFGGPQAVKGGPGSTCGQAGQAACADGQSPAVALPQTGGDLSASDPDGNTAQYGPAFIFENHGPVTVHTQGSTGPTGSVTSSAVVKNVEDNHPFHAGSPDGEVSSTCSASGSTLTASSHIVNGSIVLHTDPTTGEPTETVVLPHAYDPAPNTEYSGALDQVGDHWRIVLNEQILGPESITVNAVHMYLLGSIAIGDMIIGQSTCAVTTSAANAAPVANGDSYAATGASPLVVPAAAGVLANDTDGDGQALRASKVAGSPPPTTGGGNWTFPSDPAHGTLSLALDGSFTYTATPGYSGTDTFAYLATDSRGKAGTATVTITVAPAPAHAVADFDGDGHTDLSVFRPSTGAWYLGANAPVYLGLSGDVAVPCDYDGNGSADIAVFRDGAWYVGSGAPAFLGLSGDVPVPGDYDGNGTCDMAVFRPSTGAWYVGSSAPVYLGLSGDVPVPGDYDGNGSTDMAVFRPSTGAWYVGSNVPVYLGLSGDVPVPGDYDGNASTDVAVFRPSTGAWYVGSNAPVYLGLSGDVPVPGDYDGNASTDVAAFRPSTGAWYVGSNPPAYLGLSGDVPLPLPAPIRQSLAT